MSDVYLRDRIWLAIRSRDFDSVSPGRRTLSCQLGMAEKGAVRSIIVFWSPDKSSTDYFAKIQVVHKIGDHNIAASDPAFRNSSGDATQNHPSWLPVPKH